jgi:hypothetical protein
MPVVNLGRQYRGVHVVVHQTLALEWRRSRRRRHYDIQLLHPVAGKADNVCYTRYCMIRLVHTRRIREGF